MINLDGKKYFDASIIIFDEFLRITVSIRSLFGWLIIFIVKNRIIICEDDRKDCFELTFMIRQHDVFT